MDNNPLQTWQVKLAFLQTQLAIASDPAQIFQLEQSIEKAEAFIAKLKTDSNFMLSTAVPAEPSQPHNTNTAVPVKNPRLKGSEIAQLREAIIEAFTEEDLKTVLRTSDLDIDYETIKKGGDYKMRIFNLITEYFQPRGETGQLVQVLMQERPKDQALKDFYQLHYAS